MHELAGNNLIFLACSHAHTTSLVPSGTQASCFQLNILLQQHPQLIHIHAELAAASKHACLRTLFRAGLSPNGTLTRSALVHIHCQCLGAHGQQAYACCREPHCSLWIVPASTKSSVRSVRSRSDHHRWRKCAAMILREQCLRSQRWPKVRAEAGVQRRTPSQLQQHTVLPSCRLLFGATFVQTLPHRVCQHTIHTRRLRARMCPCMCASIHATRHAAPSAHPPRDMYLWRQ